MKRKNLLKVTSVSLSLLILFSSCASSTLIQTNVDAAELYLDGEKAGKTPYTMKDTKIVGSTTSVKIQKEGFQTFNTTISRNEEADVGAIIGGVFFLFPFLWTMKYKSSHYYELQPEGQNETINQDKVGTTNSKSTELRELKKLLDEGIISQLEFETEKKKILNK